MDEYVRSGLTRRSGKRSGAGDVIVNRTAPKPEPKDDTDVTETSINDTLPESPVHTINEPPESDLVILYSVTPNSEADEQPFTHEATLMDEFGHLITVKGLFDDGAMIGAMSTTLFRRIRNKLQGWHASTKYLRMANGVTEPATSSWKGRLQINTITIDVTLQVFDSGGNWDLLIGKPLLRAFNAIHDYTTDRVTICNKDGSTRATLENAETSADTKETKDVNSDGHGPAWPESRGFGLAQGGFGFPDHQARP